MYKMKRLIMLRLEIFLNTSFDNIERDFDINESILICIQLNDCTF